MRVSDISIVNTEYFKSQKGDGSEPTKIDKTISNLALPTSLHAMPMQPMYYKGYIGKVTGNSLCFKRVVWQKKSDVPFDLEDYYFLDSEYLKQFTKQESIYPVDAIFCASAHTDGGKRCFNKTYITEQIGDSFVPVTKINFDGTATCGYCMTAIVTFHVAFWSSYPPEISVYLRPDGTYGISNFVERCYNTAKLVHDLKKYTFPFEFEESDSIKIDNIFGSQAIADFQVYNRKNKKTGIPIRKGNNDYTFKQQGKLKSFWHRPHEMSNNKLRKSYLLKNTRYLFRVKFYTKRSPWIYFYVVFLRGKELDLSKPALYKAVCIDKKC